MGRAALANLAVLEPSFALLTSSAEASPFLGDLVLRGKRMSLDLNDFRRSTLAARDSSLMFWRRGSTEMPMVDASLRGIPAA